MEVIEKKCVTISSDKMISANCLALYFVPVQSEDNCLSDTVSQILSEVKNLNLKT